MSRGAIIDKLGNEFRERITTQRQVVYILVEIRKLLEQVARARKAAKEPKDHTYATLALCCDWAVHPVMDWENGRRIVRRFNQYQELVEMMNQAKDGRVLNFDLGFLAEFGETIRFTQFRSQLSAFLRGLPLDSQIADRDDEWANFLSYYVQVIEDCPFRAQDEGLPFTDEVNLKVIDFQQLNAGLDYRLVIEWEWVSKITGMRTVNQQFY